MGIILLSGCIYPQKGGFAMKESPLDASVIAALLHTLAKEGLMSITAYEKALKKLFPGGNPL